MINGFTPVSYAEVIERSFGLSETEALVSIAIVFFCLALLVYKLTKMEAMR